MTQLMTHLFYIFGLYFMYHELLWISDPKSKTENSKEWTRLYKLNKDKEVSEWSIEFNNIFKKKFWEIFPMLWVIVGIFSAQWFIFLCMFLFNLVIISPLVRLTKYSPAYTVIMWINAVIGFFFVIFVIINHYHLHIDVLKLIQTP